MFTYLGYFWDLKCPDKQVFPVQRVHIENFHCSSLTQEYLEEWTTIQGILPNNPINGAGGMVKHFIQQNIDSIVIYICLDAQIFVSIGAHQAVQLAEALKAGSQYSAYVALGYLRCKHCH